MILAIGDWFLFVCKRWFNSLKIFLPKNLTSLMVMSLNAYWKAWKVLFKNFWWLFLGFIFLFSLYFDDYIFNFLKTPGLQSILALGLMFISILYTISLSNAVKIENIFSFFRYVKHILIFLISFMVIYFLFLPINSYIIFYPLIDYFVSFIRNGLYIYTLFFFLDSEATFKNFFGSFFKAIKLVFYYFPFTLLILMFFEYLANYFIYYISWCFFRFIKLSNLDSIFIVNLLYLLLIVILYPLILFLLLAILYTFYRKQVHENYEIYDK